MNKKRTRILATIISLVIILPFIGILSLGIINKEEVTLHKTEVPKLTWYSENQTIDEFPTSFDVNSNEKHTIYAYLPNDCSSINTLFYRSLHQRVEIAIEDEVIYVYDTDDIRLFGIGNPRKLNIVQLPKGIENKKISITISTPYPKYSGYYSDVEVGETTQIFRLIYSKYNAGFIFSLIILALVLCLILINFIVLVFKINTRSVIYMLLAGFFVSIWLFADSKLVTIFLSGYTVNQLKYVGLMSFALMLSLYLRRNSISKYQKIFNVISLITIINIVIQCVFYVTKISDFVIFGPFNLLIILIEFIMYTLNSYRKLRERRKVSNLSVRVVIEFAIVLSLLIATILNIVLNYFVDYNLNNLLGSLFLFLIIIVYIKNIVDISNKAVESSIYKERFKEAQNYLIQSQMKPHFIFNTLGAIRTLIMSNPKVAYEMTSNFSKYLRANINKIGPGEKVSFAQELEHIKAYLAIELERFKNRLNVEYDIECDNFLIPPLSIEPLVENAVKHGVCKKVKGGTVKISSKEYEDRYVVIVEDDGVGFNVDIIDSESKVGSVGLKYIIIRLKELSDADFNIESVEGEGTKATVTIYK